MSLMLMRGRRPRPNRGAIVPGDWTWFRWPAAGALGWFAGQTSAFAPTGYIPVKVFVPAIWTPGSRIGAVMYGHGSQVYSNFPDNPDDPSKSVTAFAATGGSLGQWIDANKSTFPFYGIFPQIPFSLTVPGVNANVGSTPLLSAGSTVGSMLWRAAVNQLIDGGMQSLGMGLDPKRIHGVGYSSGGSADVKEAWKNAAKYATFTFLDSQINRDNTVNTSDTGSGLPGSGDMDGTIILTNQQCRYAVADAWHADGNVSVIMCESSGATIPGGTQIEIFDRLAALGHATVVGTNFAFTNADRFVHNVTAANDHAAEESFIFNNATRRTQWLSYVQARPRP